MSTHHDVNMYICPGCGKGDKVVFNFEKHLECCPDYAKVDENNKSPQSGNRKISSSSSSSSPKKLLSLPSLKTLIAKQTKESIKTASPHHPKVSSPTSAKRVMSLNKPLATSFLADSNVPGSEPKKIKERVNSGGVNKKSFLSQTKIVKEHVVKEPVKEQFKKVVDESAKEKAQKVTDESVKEKAKKVTDEHVRNSLSTAPTVVKEAKQSLPTLPKAVQQAKQSISTFPKVVKQVQQSAPTLPAAVKQVQQSVPTLPKAYKSVNAKISKPVESSRELEPLNLRSIFSDLNKANGTCPKESVKSISGEKKTEAGQENKVSESSRSSSSTITPPLLSKPRLSSSMISIAKEDSNSIKSKSRKQISPPFVQQRVKRVSFSEPPVAPSKGIASPNVSRSPPPVRPTLSSRSSNSNLQVSQNSNQMVASATESAQISEDARRGILAPTAPQPSQLPETINRSVSVPPSTGPVSFPNNNSTPPPQNANNSFPPQQANNSFPPQQPPYGYPHMPMNIPVQHMQNYYGHPYVVVPQLGGNIYGSMPHPRFMPNGYPNGGFFHGQPVGFQPVPFDQLPMNMQHALMMNQRIPATPGRSVSPPVSIAPKITNESEVPFLPKSPSVSSSERALVKYGPDILTEVGKDEVMETMDESNDDDIETYTLFYTEENLAELEKDVEGLDNSRVCYNDWEKPRQVYPDIYKKYNIKFCKPETFRPYKTSIKGLKSYVFHPLFNPQNLKSLTYSNKINPEVEFCPRELEGKQCAQITCDYQHWKTISKNDTMIMLDLRNDIPAENNEDYKKRFNGLSDLLTSSVKADLAEVYQKIKDYRQSFLKEGEYLNLSGRK
ncbi:unnamed protein product [Ambrosiozyma monospora]|uniref:Unnamed protein product n=1 Tax=Ambrosiozyma monospora TaxID=43982 RepID=A0ACB5SWQ9_AMBMO|nr:unnamed protein product [Ambrosiozyma monospora]